MMDKSDSPNVYAVVLYMTAEEISITAFIQPILYF